jgi:pimeloyl-ACP methyl ester carboxylesterase
MALAEACGREEPLLDPSAALRDVKLPTRLIHGRGDRLIPFTETLRLQRSLPAGACRGLTVTALFNHTADSAPTRAVDRVHERVKMFEAVRGMINMV